MAVRIEHHRYGKARVRLVRVRRRGEIHDVRELNVRVLCEGAFDDTYRTGDNANVLPTDTMKNTVYGLAKEHEVERVERFGEVLAKHFLAAHPPVERVTVDLEEYPWVRIGVPGPRGPEPHPHAFERAAGVGTASVVADRRGVSFTSGIRGLTVMKTTGSGFEGYPRDRFTTLPETRDRIFATDVTATWQWSRPPADFAVANSQARAAMLGAFAGEYSPSVQFTLRAMAEAALDQLPEIERVHLSLPNKHCLLVDLKPFGLENPNEVFVATDEPYGLIEGTFGRA
jgi:urate oxidase